MIKPEQVPDAVIKAWMACCSDNISVSYQEAFAAALNAWPGMRMMVDIDTGDDAAIKLPLDTQENENG